MTTKQLTAAIYARVSSDDQNYDMQLTEIREYAARMKWEVVEYTEKMSAAKARPVLARLMQDARLKKIDVVLVYKLDRFGRSVSDIVNNVLILDQHAVRLVAVTQGIDTDQKSPASRLIIHVLAAVAEFERSLIVERVRSGMAQAKRTGKHCGRPTRVWSRDEARKLQAQGMSYRKIAAQLGQSEGSIRRGLKSAG
jgi:DNA invertase Pin-like site-specific DNA recombinase